MVSFLDRSHTVAKPGYNRWLVPPAAIAVQMCIGEIYGFSVFDLPLTRVLGISRSLKGRDWSVPEVVLATYSIGLIMLGLSAAFLGKWVERNGPRKTMFASACCFSAGLVIAGIGVRVHSLGLLATGYGFIGGIGLGLGYIAPVSTLVKWFPDRPGMATGMAIMGFGSGALVGAPFAVELMRRFRSPESVGVAESFFVMAACYFVMMNFGSLMVRVPPPAWAPAGFVARSRQRKLVTNASVAADAAIKTPQFWLLWLVLCLNVTAGIGILAQASPMCQDMFGVSPMVAGGFVGLLSISNMAGRFIWSSLSDCTGRKGIYAVFFVLGCALYCIIPVSQRSANVMLFVGATCVIISMYGGGFATVPAYLRDLFGALQVGAIHGRLITAWSAAAIVGPQLVTHLSGRQKEHGVPMARAYNSTMDLMAALLIIGLACNLLIRPVDRRHHAAETTDETAVAPDQV